MRNHFFSSCRGIFVAMLLGISHIAWGAPIYTISPLVIDADVEARDIIEKKITITNISSEPATVFPTVNNISLANGGTIEEFFSPVESDQTRSLASWIEISRLGIDLRPNEVKEIVLTLRINPNPVSGTYHAFVGFGYGRNRDEARRQVEQGKAPGVIINATIAEKKLEFLKLSKFIVDRFITSTQNQAATYTFTNPGSETVVPSGEIIFYDNRGMEVGAVEVNGEKVSVPAGSEYTFTATVPAENKFGKYKAFLSVEYGDTQRGTVQDTSFFYIFPLKTILIILGILSLIIIFCAWYIHKKYFTEEDVDDSDRLMLHVRETESASKEHDINLKRE